MDNPTRDRTRFTTGTSPAPLSTFLDERGKDGCFIHRAHPADLMLRSAPTTAMAAAFAKPRTIADVGYGPLAPPKLIGYLADAALRNMTGTSPSSTDAAESMKVQEAPVPGLTVQLAYNRSGHPKIYQVCPISLHESFIGRHCFIGQRGCEMSELIGYAHVSSRGQSLDVQVEELKAAGVLDVHLYKETASARKRKGREMLNDMLTHGIRRGDTLVCVRLDTLARSTRDLLQIAETLEDKGVDLKVLEQPVDTTTSAGKLFFTLLSAFSEFEASIRAERQREGIDAALAKGEDSPFRGRPATINAERIANSRERGKTPTAIAKELGTARSSAYRYLRVEYEGH